MLNERLYYVNTGWISWACVQFKIYYSSSLALSEITIKMCHIYLVQWESTTPPPPIICFFLFSKEEVSVRCFLRNIRNRFTEARKKKMVDPFLSGNDVILITFGPQVYFVVSIAKCFYSCRTPQPLCRSCQTTTFSNCIVSFIRCMDVSSMRTYECRQSMEIDKSICHEWYNIEQAENTSYFTTPLPFAVFISTIVLFHQCM